MNMSLGQAFVTAFTYFTLTTVIVNSEIFTALSHVQGLVNIEMELSDALEDYIAEQEQRLNRLKSFAEDVSEAMQRANTDRDGYIGHPVNTYLMIKRLVNEWTEHVKSIQEEGDAEGIYYDTANLLTKFTKAVCQCKVYLTIIVSE